MFIIFSRSNFKFYFQNNNFFLSLVAVKQFEQTQGNMEEEITRRETRRSRSKTPLTLRSSVDRDVVNDGEKKKALKKNPTIE